MSGGRWVKPPVFPHTCHLPFDTSYGAIWKCECGRVYRCAGYDHGYDYEDTGNLGGYTWERITEPTPEEEREREARYRERLRQWEVDFEEWTEREIRRRSRLSERIRDWFSPPTPFPRFPIPYDD